MLPLLIGIVLLLVVNLVAVPYVLWLIGTIVGVILVIYGLWLLFTSFRGGSVDGRRVRYW